MHSGGEKSQNGVAILIEKKIATFTVKIERHGSRMIEVKIKAESVDIVIILINMTTTRLEEEVNNM